MFHAGFEPVGDAVSRSEMKKAVFWCSWCVLETESDQGSISPTFYENLLSAQIQKVQKIHSTHQSFMRFWDLGPIL